MLIDCLFSDHLSEDVKADIALEVNVGMVNLSLTFHLWTEYTNLCISHSHLGWFVRISRSYFERECKDSTPVEALQ